MTEKVLGVCKQLERLEVAGKVVVGNYEEDFLGATPAILEMSVGGKTWRTPIDGLLACLIALPKNHGNLDDIEEVLEKLSKAL